MGHASNFIALICHKGVSQPRKLYNVDYSTEKVDEIDNKNIYDQLGKSVKNIGLAIIPIVKSLGKSCCACLPFIPLTPSKELARTYTLEHID